MIFLKLIIYYKMYFVLENNKKYYIKYYPLELLIQYYHNNIGYEDIDIIMNEYNNFDCYNNINDIYIENNNYKIIIDLTLLKNQDNIIKELKDKFDNEIKIILNKNINHLEDLTKYLN